jgi:hypothetical protein
MFCGGGGAAMRLGSELAWGMVPGSGLVDCARQGCGKLMWGIAAATEVPGLKQGKALIHMARGVKNEARMLEKYGYKKNTEKVTGKEGASIPDALTKTESVEIKDALRVTDSAQLRIQAEAAQTSVRTNTLITGEKTVVTDKAAVHFDNIIRDASIGLGK